MRYLRRRLPAEAIGLSFYEDEQIMCKIEALLAKRWIQVRVKVQGYQVLIAEL